MKHMCWPTCGRELIEMKPWWDPVFKRFFRYWICERHTLLTREQIAERRL